MTGYPPTVGGVVLAGGRGRRLGQPKVGVEVGGRSLLERALDALRPWCGEIAIAVPADCPLPDTGLAVVPDRLEDTRAGVLAVLAGALERMSATDVLVLACDLPFAAPVAARLAQTRGHAVAVGPAGPQPLCARYRRVEAAGAARVLLDSGQRRLLGLLDALDATPVPASDEELLNVNTPADLARARHRQD